MATKDPLLDRLVTINDDVTTGKGRPHPQAGLQAKVIGKTPNGRQYQLDCEGTLINLPMADFSLVEADNTEPMAESDAAPEQPCAELHKFVPSRTNRTVAEDDELHALAATIKAYGILQPIIVRKLPAERLQDTFENPATRKAAFEIIAGERRFVAARVAGLRSVPYLLVEADNQLALQMQLIENLHRQNLNPIEEARQLQMLIEDFQLTREDAADAVRKSRTHVYETLRLLSLPRTAMQALKEGRLPRSHALLVLQRPTVAMQEEFAERVLTGGPDGGTMSLRSAQDLARRNYMTELDKAPFDLADALLCPKAGACTKCPKRTGATPDLWDKQVPDSCTDTACFADKKEAQLARVKAEAVQAGRQIISGKAARDIMPTETGTMRSYIALDKASQGSKAETRQVLGQDVPASRVVLIETPSGGFTEAVPVHAASAAVQEKAQDTKTKPDTKADKPKDKGQTPEPDRATLQAEYERRWRERAVATTIAGLSICPEDKADYLPSWIALHILEKLAADVPKAQLMAIFNIPGDEYYDEDLEDALSNASEAELPALLIVMMQLVCTQDLRTDKPSVFYYLKDLESLADIQLTDIQNQVKVEMKTEAAKRAGKPTTKKGEAKVKQQEASAAIAKAMQEAEGHGPNNFQKLQKVRILRDLISSGGQLLPTKDRIAFITERKGDRAWWLQLPQDPAVSLDDMDAAMRWQPSADYTEIRALSDGEAQHA